MVTSERHRMKLQLRNLKILGILLGKNMLLLFFAHFMWYLVWLRSCTVARLAFCSMDAVQVCLLRCLWTFWFGACVVIGGVL